MVQTSLVRRAGEPHLWLWPLRLSFQTNAKSCSRAACRWGPCPPRAPLSLVWAVSVFFLSFFRTTTPPGTAVRALAQTQVKSSRFSRLPPLPLSYGLSLPIARPALCWCCTRLPVTCTCHNNGQCPHPHLSSSEPMLCRLNNSRHPGVRCCSSQRGSCRSCLAGRDPPPSPGTGRVCGCVRVRGGVRVCGKVCGSEAGRRLL